MRSYWPDVDEKFATECLKSVASTMRFYIVTDKWFDKVRLESKVSNLWWKNVTLAVLMEYYLRVELPSMLQNNLLSHTLREICQKHGAQLQNNFQDYIANTVLNVKHKIP